MKGNHRRIIAVHPWDAWNFKKENLIGIIGRWKDGMMKWDHNNPRGAKGYEHGLFITDDGKRYSFYAVSTLPTRS